MKTLVPPFQLSTPSDWSCLSVVLAAPISTAEQQGAPAFRSNLFLNVDNLDPNAPISLEDYVAAQIGELKESDIFVRMMAEPQPSRTKAGVTGFVYEYIVKSPHENLSVHQIQFVTVVGHSVYAFTWSQAAGQPFLKAKAEFLKTLDSLQLVAA